MCSYKMYPPKVSSLKLSSFLFENPACCYILSCLYSLFTSKFTVRMKEIELWFFVRFSPHTPEKIRTSLYSLQYHLVITPLNYRDSLKSGKVFRTPQLFIFLFNKASSKNDLFRLRARMYPSS